MVLPGAPEGWGDAEYRWRVQGLKTAQEDGVLAAARKQRLKRAMERLDLTVIEGGEHDPA
jgi:hypothetical protein